MLTIIHRYLLRYLFRNLALCLFAFCALFLIFDFFDRFDTFLSEGASTSTIISYFLYKIPLTVNLMLPIAMLVATMLTVGLLSKSSEITAMRASGLAVSWITRPLLVTGACLSLFSIILGETVVPYSTRREREIYNIDIKQKDKRGGFSQNDFWWRSGKNFYSVGMFDSRSDTLHTLSKFELNDDFSVIKRTDAKRATWVDHILGWNMQDVSEYKFAATGIPETREFKQFPLPIVDPPENFYDVVEDPHSMSFFQLRKFIKKQKGNGIDTTEYFADLSEKFAFPFVIMIVTMVVLPFALKPARSGSLAVSFIASLVIAFSYYAVHSFSMAMGRAEIWSPMLSAWIANFLMGFVALVLNLGAEAP